MRASAAARPPVRQVDDALGQAGPLQDLNHPAGGERDLFRRLEDDGVAARDRVRQEPQRNHDREVERRDHAHDAQRLPDHRLVNSPSNVFQVVALHHRRNAACDLDVFNPATQLSGGLGVGLAVFPRNQPGNALKILFQELFEAKQELDPVPGGHRLPSRVRLRGGVHGFRDALAAVCRDGRERFVGGGIDHRGGVVPGGR